MWTGDQGYRARAGFVSEAGENVRARHLTRAGLDQSFFYAWWAAVYAMYVIRSVQVWWGSCKGWVESDGRDTFVVQLNVPQLHSPVLDRGLRVEGFGCGFLRLGLKESGPGFVAQGSGCIF